MAIKPGTRMPLGEETTDNIYQDENSNEWAQPGQGHSYPGLGTGAIADVGLELAEKKHFSHFSAFSPCVPGVRVFVRICVFVHIWSQSALMAFARPANFFEKIVKNKKTSINHESTINSSISCWGL